MANQTSTPQIKSMIGRVVSAGMVKTVSVEVTTFKVHPLYHKRYRWTKKYLSDTGEFTPQLGDMVKIVSSRPISRRKQWVVAEVVSQAPAVSQTVAAKKATKAPVAKTGKARTKKA